MYSYPPCLAGTYSDGPSGVAFYSSKNLTASRWRPSPGGKGVAEASDFDAIPKLTFEGEAGPVMVGIDYRLRCHERANCRKAPLEQGIRHQLVSNRRTAITAMNDQERCKQKQKRRGYQGRCHQKPADQEGPLPIVGLGSAPVLGSGRQVHIRLPCEELTPNGTTRSPNVRSSGDLHTDC
jgi:hypothetical protein